MKKRKNDNLNTNVETNEFPGLDGQSVFQTMKITKGAVQFTKIKYPDELKPQFDAMNSSSGDSQFNLALEWQQFRELSEDHGFSLCYSALSNGGGAPYDGFNVDKIISRIKWDKGDDVWKRIEVHLSQFEENSVSYKMVLYAVWAQFFEEPFEERWLAANALHAAYVLEDYFAFGYLTALLDQKVNSNETHMLRGKKNVESAKLGGQIRSRQVNLKTNETLREMARMINNGQTISRSAALAYNNGYGSSEAANKRLWTRHSKK